MRGAIVCSNQIAADAGAEILRQGGNAVDAAVTVALSLCVVDPANCGIGGYGGFMLIQEGPNQAPHVIDFNTRVPSEFTPDLLLSAEKNGHFISGAATVAAPVVLNGLLTAHQQFGSKPFEELLNDPIASAKNGFVIGKNLNMALRWAESHEQSFSESFKAIFAPQGHWLKLGQQLVQADLANTLEQIQTNLGGYFYSGEFARQTCHYIQEAGGWLQQAHFDVATAEVYHGHQVRYGDNAIYGPNPLTSGYGIVCDALDYLSSKAYGSLSNVSDYIERVAEALRHGWEKKKTAFTRADTIQQHTTHFCVTDMQGMTVSCTFTQGPLWFGSGMLSPGTGVILNCAANLFRQIADSEEWLCITNLSPNIMLQKNGTNIASGSPGGSRIPAIILQIILEMAQENGDLSTAINRLRVSVTPSGALELEDAELAEQYKSRRIYVEEYFGPSSAILRDCHGDIQIGMDHRFDTGFVLI